MTDGAADALHMRSLPVDPFASGTVLEVVVVAEDVAADAVLRAQVDLVVLATGMVPRTASEKVPFDGPLTYDEFGFLVPDTSGDGGIHAAGCVKRPSDVAASVQDATGASVKAIRG